MPIVAHAAHTITVVTTLITGVTGQDGSYLAEQLATTNKRLVGTLHPHEAIPPYVAELQARGSLSLHMCDIGDTVAFRHLLRDVQPHRVFHLAAISTASETAANLEQSQRVNVASVEALVDWAKRDSPNSRTLVMSSASAFGTAPAPQSEDTPCSPADEYGRQKLRVRQIAADARRTGCFVACAIPFNHESPRRDDRFVFAKVCRAAASISRGLQQKLTLGNLEARRDWGYAPEYCAALLAMLDAPEPLELVLATGESRSVRELAAAAFARAGITDWEPHVDSDFMLHRAGDFDLVGDASRALQAIGWLAQTRFAQLVELMVDSAL